MIKRIFTDMDGTLLNSTGIVSDTTAQAIKDHGIPVTLVSARAPMEMAAAIDKLGLTSAQIGFNGGLIYERIGTDWKTISARPIKQATAKQIIEAVQARFPKISTSYYDRDRWYADHIDAGINHEQGLTGQAPTVASVAEVFNHPDVNIFKIMMITFNETEMHRLSDFFEAANFTGITAVNAGPAYLEVTSAEAQKSRGINYILEHEHLVKEETAAFGDGHNDLPMLNMVGCPIVMENALPEIKSVAQFVTKSNEEDGIAWALNNRPEFHQ